MIIVIYETRISDSLELEGMGDNQWEQWLFFLLNE